MADQKLETVEPDPSSTSIANDTFINKNATMQEANPTADASAKVQTKLPSTDDVDKAIAEVEARKAEKETAKEVQMETTGYEAPKQNHDRTVEEKKEPSKRVQEGQKWNNRDRNGKPRADHKKNYKSDLTSQAESSDPVEIRKQVSEQI